MDVFSRHGLKHSLCRSVLVSRSSSSSSVSLLCFAIWIVVAYVCFGCQCLSYSVLSFPDLWSTVTSFGKIPSDHSSKYCKFLLWDFRVWVLYTFGFSLSVCEDLACLLLQLFYVLFLLLVMFPLCLSLGNFPLTYHDTQWPTVRLCQVCQRAFLLASLFLPLCVLMSLHCSFS